MIPDHTLDDHPPAHTEELTKLDYQQCADFVLSGTGVLWSLIIATTPR